MSYYRCPKCSSLNVATERRPNGNSACGKCGYKASTGKFLHDHAGITPKAPSPWPPRDWEEAAWPIVEQLNKAISKTDEEHPAWKHLQRAVSLWQRIKNGLEVHRNSGVSGLRTGSSSENGREGLLDPQGTGAEPSSEKEGVAEHSHLLAEVVREAKAQVYSEVADFWAKPGAGIVGPVQFYRQKASELRRPLSELRKGATPENGGKSE